MEGIVNADNRAELPPNLFVLYSSGHGPWMLQVRSSSSPADDLLRDMKEAWKIELLVLFVRQRGLTKVNPLDSEQASTAPEISQAVSLS